MFVKGWPWVDEGGGWITNVMRGLRGLRLCIPRQSCDGDGGSGSHPTFMELGYRLQVAIQQ